MSRRHVLSTVVFVAALAAVGALLAHPELGGTSKRPATSVVGPTSYARESGDAGGRELGIDMSSFVAHGRFFDRTGRPYSVGSIAESKPSGRCVAVVGPGGDVGSTCSQPRLFSRGPVIWLEGFEGGPAPADRTSEYVTGIAAAPVTRIAVVESDGSSHDAPLSSDNAFFFEVDPADLARGTYVDHLEATGANGAVVQRVALNDRS